MSMSRLWSVRTVPDIRGLISMGFVKGFDASESSMPGSLSDPASSERSECFWHDGVYGKHALPTKNPFLQSSSLAQEDSFFESVGKPSRKWRELPRNPRSYVPHSR